MTELGPRFHQLQARIRAAEQRFARTPHSVSLLAVTKTWPAEVVRAAVAAGQRRFGENYAQEGIAKVGQLIDLGLEWHFIGRVQSNKTTAIATHFDWVQSLARLDHAQRLALSRPANRAPLNVCIQVNISSEASKSGVNADDVIPLAQAITHLPQLRLRGLMALPEPETDFARQCANFRRVRHLFEELQTNGFAIDTLSMGMSDDLEAAIAEGTTLVRVGTALFGSRGG